MPAWVPLAGIVLALASRAPFPHALRAVPGVLDTALLIGLTVLAVVRLRDGGRSTRGASPSR